MTLAVLVKNRGGTYVQYEPAIRLSVESISSGVRGGAIAAEILVTGDERSIQQLIDNWLGYSVEVITGDDGGGRGVTVWAGQVYETRATIGALTVGRTLDTMANAVKIGYMVRGASGQTRRTTDYVSDAESITKYGQKELLGILQIASDTQAAQVGETLLAARKDPRPVWDGFGGTAEAESVTARLYCRGWRESLGWRYYAAGGDIVLISYIAEPEDTTFDVGAAAVPSEYSFGFRFTGTGKHQATQLRLKLVKIGAPADNLKFEIWTNAGAGALGVRKATWTMAGSGLTTEHAWYDIDVPDCEELDPATDYLLYITRTGAVDAANFYRVIANSAAGYSDGITYQSNGAAWVAQAQDILFEMSLEPVAEITAVIQDIYSQCGQLLAGIEIQTTTSVYVPAYRSGDQTGLDVLNELLDATDLAGARLAYEITPERRLRVYAEPAAGVEDVFFTRDGRIVSALNAPVPKSACTYGVWARLRDTLLSDDYAVFIERAEYAAESDRYSPTARDQKSPFDVLGLREG